MQVLVVGASENPERYSNKAMQRLKEAGKDVLAFGLKSGQAHGISIESKINPAWRPHTITLYIGPKGLQEVIGDLLALNPQRIIFNPGTESEILEEKARDSGVDVLEACTLVMLSRGVF